MLIRDHTVGVGFGHLTHQEYLAAKWLIDNDSPSFLWSRLLHPWWQQVLKFYAAEKEDVSSLIREGLLYRADVEARSRLEELAALATLTSPPVSGEFLIVRRTRPTNKVNSQCEFHAGSTYDVTT